MKLEQPTGNYYFFPGGPPYSAAVVAAPGFEIVHANLAEPLPLGRGLAAIKAHLASRGRQPRALCGIELRCPAPYSFEGFGAFNEEYLSLMRAEGLLPEGPNPVARTNIAPLVAPPREQVIHAFSYTVPASRGKGPSFVIAGAGELVDSALHKNAIVRVGETSPEAMAEKAAAVMDIMEKRLGKVGAGWEHVTAINVYTAHDVSPFLRERILERAGVAARLGIRWFLSRPPVNDIEFEMDLHGVAADEVCHEDGR